MSTVDGSAPATTYGTPGTTMRNGPGTAALVLGLIALGVSVLNSPAGKTLQQCLKNANGNKAAVSQCDAQYASSR